MKASLIWPGYSEPVHEVLESDNGFWIKSCFLGYQCNERPRKLGCFQDSLQDRLMTLEFRVKIKDSDWIGDKWNEHLDKLLCKYVE